MAAPAAVTIRTGPATTSGPFGLGVMVVGVSVMPTKVHVTRRRTQFRPALVSPPGVRERRRDRSGILRRRSHAPCLLLHPGFALRARVCGGARGARSEEHTSELQSQSNLVCRLLLEKKKKNNNNIHRTSRAT